MIKTLTAGLLFLSSSVFASVCPTALPVDHPAFCGSFKTAAACHCVSSGLPAPMCQDMNVLYTRMISMFGSVEAACRSQRHTTPQICTDSWNCYRKGGVLLDGRKCSSTGQAC